MDKRNLPALVASRICHDIISPIGAIGNGVELLSLSGGSSPELDLITDSVASANSRVRLFRLVFGATGSGQMLKPGEITALFRDLGKTGRLSCTWQVDEPEPRDHVRAALLAMLCLDTALKTGGEIRISKTGDRWTVRAEGRTLRREDGLWSIIEGGEDVSDVSPASVQFLLLPLALSGLGRSATVADGPEMLEISF
ncbi:histidine phosphotransferase family protein [Roseisalinus antarcticus]|uniref:Histidine phosphotransferase ChpT C-terminal domain-containing protein n=1 Tax=Roseisalinus antarcticus TaxID=254357 RepID=A0A1Y5TB04_9RHOB|nr:histidine phosphotransferase family protein [Roseisalinus antarcticus]SLN59498.1 hypothetical protein ROA7023_02730 [Roseisalinus antarcticus]